eukprot:scaffold10782_cov45-Phaeocystis_antarctica.AAC.2
MLGEIGGDGGSGYVPRAAARPCSIRWESERVGHEGTEGKGRGGGLAGHSAPAGLVLWPYIYLFSLYSTH